MNTRGGRMRPMALGCALALAAASLRAGTTYYVATNGNDTADGTNWATAVATITNGLAKAKPNVGDVVLLSNGTHVLSAAVPKVDYGITVRGLSREETIVDGNNAVQCFSYVYGTIDNLSVTRGYFSYGAALAMYAGASATRLNIYSNYSSAGYTMYPLSPVLISNCFIHGNTAGTEGGAGIGLSAVTGSEIVECVISNNVTSNKYGAGIMIVNRHGQSGAIRDCTIVDNIATGGASSECGGIYCEYQATSTYNVVISRCVMARNIGGKRPSGSATYGGGGLNLGSNTGRVENCLIYGNTDDRGGGVTVRKTNTFVNCTIVSNTAAVSYGGIYKYAGEARVRNSIVYYNGPDMQAGVNSFDQCCLTTTNGLAGEGNITNVPGCVAPDSRDWRLASGSPCIDTGLTESWMADALDVARFPRLDRFTGRVDRGAYEYQPAGVLLKVH